MKIGNPLMSTAALFAVAIAALLSGCATTKDVAYLQTIDKELRVTSAGMQDPLIQPKDMLGMLVSATDPISVAPFNGMLWNPTQEYNALNTQQRSYLVDNDGMAKFPVVGLVKVGGLTLRQAEEALRAAISKYLSDPSLTVAMQFTNYRYSVIGEVKRPGLFTAPSGKVSIFEALANAGDMTVYGLRDQVRLLREDTNGNKTIVTLDLKSPDIISSPYYYLQQGDVIYVVPNDAIASSSNISSGTTIWVSVASLGFSLINILLTILR